MEDAGSTPEEVDQAIQALNGEYDNLEGLDGSCKFETSDLFSMLSRWEVGSASGSDYDVAECEGDFFNPSI